MSRPLGARLDWIGLLAGLVITTAFPSVHVQAATIYKSVGADGKVIYSDRRANGATLQKTLVYPELSASPLPASVRRYRDELAAGVESRLPLAHDGTARLFTASWCGYCRKARDHLARRGIEFREIDIDSPAGVRAYAGIGGHGVPVLVWRDQRLDGYAAEAYDALADAVAAR